MRSLEPKLASAAVTASALVLLAAYLRIRPALIRPPSDTAPKPPARSPRWRLPLEEGVLPPRHPYPLDLLPGGRDVETPYGFLRVYEWGSEDGQKVLLLHGIGTPCPALGEMARELVERGYRVMLFDFFGRGYSDAPTDLPYDARLYVTQIHLALASSPLAWSGANAFHLIGYSLGGAVAASFARYHPHAVRSLVLVTPGGLIRSHHVSRTSRLLYSEGVLPEPLLRRLVRRRLEPRPSSPPSGGGGTGDGGQASSEFDDAVIDPSRPGLRVADLMEWQLRRHPGFVPAYRSTLRHTPIYDQGDAEWKPLRGILAARRQKGAVGEGSKLPGLTGGRICFVLGETDSISVPEEIGEDAKRVLGDEAVVIEVVKGAGHEVGITRGRDVAGLAVEFWMSSEQAT
ncbi:alpha/beta-hydrolase [Sodiomyces alkalinus F11]|uniref:Alpha/beta-hydrolase n=1 Tax=Sodiomyces alkalinus (strain CBS 110278 / VKM F-3762 / F11) TaxID=1314773 RepID=A0A3N2PWA8_SODAK|nr:alpha/beta-hydrolase [Sodiomyces alkalinus F11]ROT38772.1 alpha/beta-hydrolase [Sodiomyces alkalinus F11]